MQLRLPLQRTPYLHFITTFCQLSISTHRSSPGSHTPVGIIAALAILGALAILSGGLCIYLFWRLRHSYASLNEEKMSGRIIIDPFVRPSRVEERPALTVPSSAAAFSQGTSAASAVSFPSSTPLSGLAEGDCTILSVCFYQQQIFLLCES